MPFVPEISAEFSAQPEFSGDVSEKDLSTGRAQTFDIQITNQILFHCANASLIKILCCIYYETYQTARFCCYWPRDFPAVSVVAFWAWECKKSPFRDQKAGIFRKYL